MESKKIRLPRLISGKSFKDKNISDLELLERVLFYGSMGKLLPEWLVEELAKRVDPILKGEEVDFRNWTADHTRGQREKLARKEAIIIYEAVEKLYATKRYHTDIEKEGNVYEAAAEQIEVETGLSLGKHHIKNTHIKVKRLTRELEDI